MSSFNGKLYLCKVQDCPELWASIPNVCKTGNVSPKCEELSMTHPISLPLLSRVKLLILQDIFPEVNVVIEGLSGACLHAYASYLPPSSPFS